MFANVMSIFQYINDAIPHFCVLFILPQAPQFSRIIEKYLPILQLLITQSTFLKVP